MKITEYFVADAESVITLNRIVNGLLDQGWECHGSIFAVHVPGQQSRLDSYTNYLQTMVKYGDDKKPAGFFNADDSITMPPCPRNHPRTGTHDFRVIRKTPTEQTFKCFGCDYTYIDKTRNNE
jgi:hypothetical protein